MDYCTTVYKLQSSYSVGQVLQRLTAKVFLAASARAAEGESYLVRSSTDSEKRRGRASTCTCMRDCERDLFSAAAESRARAKEDGRGVVRTQPLLSVLYSTSAAGSFRLRASRTGSRGQRVGPHEAPRGTSEKCHAGDLLYSKCHAGAIDAGGRIAVLCRRMRHCLTLLSRRILAAEIRCCARLLSSAATQSLVLT